MVGVGGGEEARVDVGVDIGVVDEDRDAMRRAAMRTNSRHGDAIDSQDQSHFFPQARSRGRRKEEIKKARGRGRSERRRRHSIVADRVRSGWDPVWSGAAWPGLVGSRRSTGTRAGASKR